MEGGANVLSEAMVDGIPVLASQISGSEGILGKEYPGLFPVGNTYALMKLLLRVETDGDFRKWLKEWCTRRAKILTPGDECKAWIKFMAELHA